jgi:hypothetical protein
MAFISKLREMQDLANSGFFSQQTGDETFPRSTLANGYQFSEELPDWCSKWSCQHPNRDRDFETSLCRGYMSNGWSLHNVGSHNYKATSCSVQSGCNRKQTLSPAPLLSPSMWNLQENKTLFPTPGASSHWLAFQTSCNFFTLRNSIVPSLEFSSSAPLWSHHITIAS